MPIRAGAVHGKVVNFRVVFFGFSLHHLFMHLNLFGHHSALPSSGGSNG